MKTKLDVRKLAVFALLLILVLSVERAYSQKKISQHAASSCDGVHVFHILDSEDDAGPNPLEECEFKTTWNEIYLGTCPDNRTPIVSGLRIQNISIARGTPIYKAYIEFTADGPVDTELWIKIFAENTAHADAFGVDSQPKDRERLAEPYATWRIRATDHWEWNQTWVTPDLTEIVQSILNRSDWKADNAMAFIFEGQANVTERHRRIMGFDRPKDRYEGDVARLVIITEPVIPMPKSTANENEVQNLWIDLQVQEAHAALCSELGNKAYPGSDHNLGVMDWQFGECIEENEDNFVCESVPCHGTFCLYVAAGPADGSGPGLLEGELPGIASGAGRFNENPDDHLDLVCYWLKGLSDKHQLPERFKGYKDLCVNSSLPNSILRAFSELTKDVGGGGIVAVSMKASGYLDKDKAIKFINRVHRYINEDNGIVVLPSTFFATEIANDAEIKTRLKSSGVLIAHAVQRADSRLGVPVPTDSCEATETWCATNREEINIAVPTTNKNNSVAVPAVAAVALLMQNANPALSSQQICDILTNTYIFQTAEINITKNTTKPVAVLNALNAVGAAKYGVGQ